MVSTQDSRASDRGFKSRWNLISSLCVSLCVPLCVCVSLSFSLSASLSVSVCVSVCLSLKNTQNNNKQQLKTNKPSQNNNNNFMKLLQHQHHRKWKPYSVYMSFCENSHYRKWLQYFHTRGRADRSEYVIIAINNWERVSGGRGWGLREWCRDWMAICHETMSMHKSQRWRAGLEADEFGRGPA